MATYIETALVSSAGKLLIQLDDGTVIDAGYVRGGPGPAGKDGQDGAPGIPGAKGDPGENGAKWHTGVGAPEVALGDNGDIYMDVAASVLPIYQKVGGNWMFLCNLKVTPAGAAGGQGGAAGGGGSIIIYPMPDGGTPPSTDNDGKPIDTGDIWYDPNTGYIWIYDGTVWVPMGQRPPVSVGPTPPDWNSSGDVDNRYPITEGDLWFDSEQLALYVAAEDAGGQLVWIISTPANRSGVTETVSTPFVFPLAIDGETVYNPTSDTWYVWNEFKKQWIDIPTNCQTTDYVYKGEGTDPGEGEFKVGAGSTPELSEIYLFGDKRPFLKDGGYLFINDESHTIIYANYDNAANTTVVAITPGLENLVLDESYNFSSCAPFIEKQEVYYGEEKPTVEDDDLEIGNIWIDKEDNKLYVWDGTAWSEVTACSSLGMHEYLKKYGDTVDDATSKSTYFWNEGVELTTGDAADTPNASLLVRDGEITAKADGLVTLEGYGVDILSTGNTIEIGAKSDVRCYSQDGNVTINANNLGSETINRTLDDTSDAKQITNKEYVDAQDQKILDLIASPTVDAGAWTYSNTTPLAEGSFHISKIDTNGPNLDYADSFSETTTLILHEQDSEGTVHSFTDIARGNYIQLFDDEDVAVALYYVRAEPYLDANKYYTLVTYVSGSDKLPEVDEAFSFKLYADAPGVSSEFVNKRGDVMAGSLTFSESLDGKEGGRIFGTSTNVHLSSRLESGSKFSQVEVSKSAIKLEVYAEPGGALLSFLGIRDREIYLQGKTVPVFISGEGIGISSGTDSLTDNYLATGTISSLNRALSWNSTGVVVHNALSIGEDAANAFMATEDNHAATKKYADGLLDFSQYQELS